MPAWCTPTPLASRRLRILPKAVEKLVPRQASWMRLRCSLVAMPNDESACAESSAAAWAKCTM